MRLARKETRKRRNREDVILFTVGPHRMAISARSVEKIEHASAMKPIVEASPLLRKVKNIFTSGAISYLVLDAAAHMHVQGARPARLLLLRGTNVAVAVDAIDRIEAISNLSALPRSFSGEERAWYRGLTLLKEGVLPVVRVETFTNDSEIALANALAHRISAAAQEASA